MADPTRPGEPVGLARLLGVEVDHRQLVDRLRTVIDPELGIDIVSLGLVYGAQVVDGVAHILMTTTTPACPIGAYLVDAIDRALLELPGILDVDVELTHDPPWTPHRMSDEAKVQLGWAQ
jgi:metal-sulfur cluster biosynthetic enzyme